MCIPQQKLHITYLFWWWTFSFNEHHFECQSYSCISYKYCMGCSKLIFKVFSIIHKQLFLTRFLHNFQCEIHVKVHSYEFHARKFHVTQSECKCILHNFVFIALKRFQMKFMWENCFSREIKVKWILCENFG